MSLFARIGSIKGESQDARHRDEIDVLSWSWGVAQASRPGGGGGAGAGAGRASVQDVVLTHRIDRATPLLLTACARGEHLRDAVITVRKAGLDQQEYLVITLTDVLVTRVSLTASAETDSTLEEVVLTFAKVDLEYKPPTADGSLEDGIHFTHDLRGHRSG